MVFHSGNQYTCMLSIGLASSSPVGEDACTGLLDITLGACEVGPCNACSLDISPSISVNGYGSISNPLNNEKLQENIV